MLLGDMLMHIPGPTVTKVAFEASASFPTSYA
jgi:hypothetical protein